MKTRIVIHATKTPSDMKVRIDDIEEMNSQSRYTDPLPYHYIVNIDGTILKGRHDKEICEHCGKFSRDSFSVAYAGGVDTDSGRTGNTMNEEQEKVMRFLIRQLQERVEGLEVTGANRLLHPDEPLSENEPYFDVEEWMGELGFRGFLGFLGTLRFTRVPRGGRTARALRLYEKEISRNERIINPIY